MKYKNSRASYKGRMYDSKMEKDDAMWLDSLLQQKRIKEVEPQHKLILSVNGKRITTHIVDFLVTLNDGRQKLVETKGFATNVFLIKRKLTQALYPEMEYLTNPNEKQLLY